MARFGGMSGTMWREQLDPPGLYPPDIADISLDPSHTGPDGVRTSAVQEYPITQTRLMLADRVHAVWQPDTNYANTDPQKGGAPGAPNGSSGITSESPSGVTTAAGVPNSPLKLSYGLADYSSEYPTFVGAHLKIQNNANPNRPQVNPTPFNVEGPNQNTQYTTPSPWAAGVFIG